jgi:hypothetical protein
VQHEIYAAPLQSWFILQLMDYQLTNLHKRDGIEFIMVCVRSSTRHLLKTVMFLTPATRGFLTSITKVQPLTGVNQFEAFAINRIAGVLHNHKQHKDSMKADIRKTLHSQIGR